MNGTEVYLTLPSVYWAFFIILGSYILSYRVNNPLRISFINVFMNTAFVASALLILLEPVVAVVYALFNNSLFHYLSIYDVIRLAIVEIIYALMFLTGIIINIKHTLPKPEEPHETGKPNKPAEPPILAEPSESEESNNPPEK